MSGRCAVCLVMSRRYVEAHWADICGYASVIEDRGQEELIRDNEENLRQCQARGLEYILMDNS